MNKLKVLLVGVHPTKEKFAQLKCSEHEVVAVGDIDAAIQTLQWPEHNGDFSFIVAREAYSPPTIHDLLGFCAEKYPFLVVAVPPRSDERNFKLVVPRGYRITGAKRDPANVEEVACILQALFGGDQKEGGDAP